MTSATPADTTVAVDYDPFADAPLARVVPATESQKEIWLAASIEPAASLAYNESVTLELHGPLDANALRRALQAVLDRHEALRGTLSADGEQFCIVAEAALPFVERDLSNNDEAMRQAAIAETLRRVVETEFDLAKSPMLRCELLRLSAEDHLLILSTHHIVCDGWSFGVIVRDLATLYAIECEGSGQVLPVADSFADFAEEETRHPLSAEFRADESYWLSRYTQLPEPLELPVDRSRPRQRSFASQREDLTLDAERVSAIKRVGASKGASLYATLLASFGVLLQRLAGQDDLVIGIPSAGQSGTDRPGMVGHAVNVLPLRMSLDPAMSFTDTLSGVRSQLLDAFEHQRYTFGTLLRRLAMARDPGRLPLVSVLFNLDPGLDDDSLGFKGLKAKFAGVPRSYENFELFINAVQAGGALRLECQYNSALFDALTIRRWLELYATLLGDITTHASQSLSSLNLLSAQARDELRALQPKPKPFTRCRVESLFFAQAATTPDRIALCSGGQAWTYAELATRTRMMAAALRTRGIGANDLVGVSLDRGADMIAAILGVLASGAGYVPLDPAFPRERLEFMAADAGLALLLTESKHVATMQFDAARTLVIDAPDALDPAHAGFTAIEAGADTESVAYVIYTSGSTGKPKGVRVPHRSVVNFLSSMRNQPGLEASDRLLAVTTLSFDIAVLEIFMPLSVGAMLVLASGAESKDGRELAGLLDQHEITVMQATPATWRMLVEIGWQRRPGFKALCGGEPLPAALAAELLKRCDSLWNLYGPTETTVWSTLARIEDPVHGISIGRPIDNTTVWILDEHAAVCPMGVPGEIAIGGAGVTLGYLDRPDLTADRFIADPFSDTAGALLYRTGDRGRWRNDGLLEHLGRLDHQVKLRGFRIELGEIETNLARHSEINQVVAMVREDRPGDQRLVAYLTAQPAGAAEIDDATLRTYLRATLPDYMIPQHFVRLDSIPLLPNGKINRARLPAPTVAHAEQVQEHVGPRNEQERRVAAAMESVLSLAGIGVHDDFFALGGHSLLAARLTAQLGREFKLLLSLGLLFEHPTVAGLAAAIGQRLADPANAATSAIGPLADPSQAPLSLLQKRLWLFEQLDPATVVYNTPSAHRLRGIVDASAFERAFLELTRRQRILRTAIARDGSEVIQRIHDVIPPNLFPAEDLSGLDPTERESRLLARLDELTNVVIDLESAPLYRIHMFRLTAEEHVFFFMPHHIIWDGWSFDLFYTEFAELYAAYRENRQPVLEPLPVSYGEFAQWHTQWLLGGDYTRQFQRELGRWRERLRQFGAPQQLPTDKPRGKSLVGLGETEWIKVSADVTAQMRALGRSVDATLFISLLAAYYVVLWRFVGDRNLVVGTPVRVRASSEVENLMGLFTNLLPLPIDVDPDEDFLSFVGRVKAVVMSGFASPDVQLEDLMREPGMRELAGATHFYQAQFSYQDARERICNWGGLAQEQVLLFQRAASEDLAIWFLEHANGMTGGVLYNADLFEGETARLFARRYLALLERIVAEPTRSVAELTSVDATDLERLRSFAAPIASAPDTQGLHEVFESIVDENPSRPIVRIGSWATHGGELEQRANRIADCLRARGVGMGSIVAVCAEHSVSRVAGLLAILKMGAICLPLDPQRPPELSVACMQDAGASVLIGDAAVVSALAWTQAASLCFETDANEIIGASAERPRLVVPIDQPAFIFHEHRAEGIGSGQTLSHAGLRCLLSSIAQALALEPGQIILGLAGPGEPLAVIETLLALVHGAEYVPAARPDIKTSTNLSALMAKVRPRLMFADSTTWRELAAQDLGESHLTAAVCVDDAIDRETVLALRSVTDQAWLASGGNAALPFIALGRMPAAGSGQGFASRPLAWPTVSLLDERGNPAPIGSTGCVWLAGPLPFGICGGSVTRDRQIKMDGNKDLFATSLRARWLADGRLAFIPVRSSRTKPSQPLPARPPSSSPSTSLSFSEQWLAAIWQDLLGLPRVEASDNFFDLGGHSLLAMTLVARVEDQTGVRLGILKIANNSLRALAADLSREAIEEGKRKPTSLRDRALKLFGFKREPEH